MATTTQSSLMKKTKAELVNIILRKDDVESRLTQANKDLEEKHTALNNAIANRDKKITKLNMRIDELSHYLNNAKENSDLVRKSKDDVCALVETYKQELDNAATDMAVVQNKLMNFKVGFIITSAIALISIILLIFA